ncbi:hypothetical protein [Mesoplasma photuris]|uniref:hypothetical protein n=1 Tax=Mesoplasma photuris TaxID=217731 RepID=UPI0004E12167|nr:hypothetical protein [Mesoplasma photuris]
MRKNTCIKLGCLFGFILGIFISENIFKINNIVVIKMLYDYPLKFDIDFKSKIQNRESDINLTIKKLNQSKLIDKVFYQADKKEILIVPKQNLILMTKIKNINSKILTIFGISKFDEFEVIRLSKQKKGEKLIEAFLEKHKYVFDYGIKRVFIFPQFDTLT